MKKKKVIIISIFLILFIVVAVSSSYALFVYNITKDTNFKMMIGNLELNITDTTTEDKYILNNAVPTRDDVALEQDGYTFTITNTGTIDSSYSIYLDDILLDNNLDRLSSEYVRFNLYNENTKLGKTSVLSSYDNEDRLLTTGILKTNESVSYTLRMWLDYMAGNDQQNKYYAVQVRVVGTQTNANIYKDESSANSIINDN